MSDALDAILSGWSFKCAPEQLRITRTFETTGKSYDVYLEENCDGEEHVTLMRDCVRGGHVMIGMNVDDENFDRVLYSRAPGDDVVETLRSAIEALAATLRAAERVTAESGAA